MNYKSLILLVSVATVVAGVYVYKKTKNNLPIFDEATNTIIQNDNIYATNGKLIKCVNTPCYDNLPN
jgi:hypothetical protein